MIMKGLYHGKHQTPSKLILTNFKYLNDLSMGTLEEDELKSLKHTILFQKILKNLDAEDQVFSTKYSLQELTTVEVRKAIKSEEMKDDTAKILQILDQELQTEEDVNKKLCFMDMRAEKMLGDKAEGQNDRHEITLIVFGGILGDHPPKDRAKNFREENFKVIRNLGKV